MAPRKDAVLSAIGIPVNIQKFKMDCMSLDETSFVATGTLNDLDEVYEEAAKATGISIEEAEIYEEELSCESLACEVLPPCNEEFYDDKCDKLIPLNMQCYKFYKSLQVNKSNQNIKKQMTLNYHRPIEKEDISMSLHQTELQYADLIFPPEVILQISIFKEIKQVKTKGLFVLGSQKLSDFVDGIECAMDLEVCWQENSENPFLENIEWNKSTRHSSCLYIGDTLYIDKRKGDHVDYTTQILELFRVNGEHMSRGMGPHSVPKVGDMCLVKFDELTVNIGMPYVFIHQGCCEHVVTIESIKMFHQGDDPRKVRYPKLYFRGGPRRLNCVICKERHARWITYNDELAPASPSHFCFECFHMMHYDADGVKLYDFNAYVYLENVEDMAGYTEAFRCFREKMEKALENQ